MEGEKVDLIFATKMNIALLKGKDLPVYEVHLKRHFGKDYLPSVYFWFPLSHPTLGYRSQTQLPLWENALGSSHFSLPSRHLAPHCTQQ